MSRFWENGSGSDSDSGSGDETESHSSSDNSGDDDGQNPYARRSSSSSDHSVDRRIKTAKEKELDKVRAVAITIKNKITADDWSSVSTAFNELLSVKESCKSLNKTPACFTRALVRIDDGSAKANDKELKKELNKSNAKAMTVIRQRLKKLAPQYLEEIVKFRQNPIQTEDEDDDDEEADQPVQQKTKSQKTKAPEPEKTEPAPPKEWTQDMVKDKLAELMMNRGKKGYEHSVMVSELRKLERKCTEPKLNLQVLMLLISARFDLGASVGSLSSSHWSSAFAEILKALGLVEAHPNIKVIESKDIPETTEEVSPDPTALRLNGSFLAFCERLDDEFMKALQAADPHTQDYISRLRDENKFLLLAVRVENFYRNKMDTVSVHRIALRRIEKLYYRREELNPLKHLAKSWPAGLAHPKPLTLVSQTETQATTPRGDTDFSQMTPVAKLAAKFEESSAEKKELEQKIKQDPENAVLGHRGCFEMFKTIEEVIHDLATMLYKGADERAKTRAMLCQIYNLALHARYYEARDLVLMSHLQEGIKEADIPTQVLFNRIMAQLGLSAFRNGLISEAHSCLAEFYTGGRIKELLAQGVVINRFAEKTPEQERIARMRQLPYHMHINLELLDTVHLISAMLLEVPNMARGTFEVKRRVVISKHFRRLLEFHERQVFNGPPESTHDFIMTATRALMKGDVDACTRLLVGLKVWGLLPNEVALKEMLTTKIRQEGLRTYLFTYSNLYTSIESASLSQMFHLPASSVHSIVSNMIVGQELHGAWDQPTGCIIMHRAEPSQLQLMALQYSEKVEVLVEHNEKMLDTLQSAGMAEGTFKGRDGYRGGRRGRYRGNQGHQGNHQGGHQERGHQDRSHQDRSHQDRSHQDRSHQDRSHQDRNYQDRNHQERGHYYRERDQQQQQTASAF